MFCVQCIYLYECILGRFWINGNSKTLHTSETDQLEVTGSICRSLYTIHTRLLLPSSTTRSVVISSLVSMNLAWIPAACLSSSVFPNWKNKIKKKKWWRLIHVPHHCPLWLLCLVAHSVHEAFLLESLLHVQGRQRGMPLRVWHLQGLQERGMFGLWQNL